MLFKNSLSKKTTNYVDTDALATKHASPNLSHVRHVPPNPYVPRKGLQKRRRLSKHHCTAIWHLAISAMWRGIWTMVMTMMVTVTPLHLIHLHALSPLDVCCHLLRRGHSLEPYLQVLMTIPVGINMLRFCLNML